MHVQIVPLPTWARKISPRFRPQHPPIFDGEPTQDDVDLARALFAELDPESQAWYRGSAIFATA